MEEEFLEIDNKNGWNYIFQDIRNKSSIYSHLTKEAKKNENKNLNRYRDVNPFDHSRVCLRRGEKDYINASFVDVPTAERSYILTQGPLPVTTGHFWLMIWEQNSKAILMLNRVIEKNTVKCHQYWPIGFENGGSNDLILTDVSLKVTFVSQLDKFYYIERRFLLTDLESNDSREILQFHYITWPDFGVPQSPGAFLDFLFCVRNSGVLDNAGPPVVHCSAGIGRSGTFCLVDSCLVLIEKSNNPNSINIQEQLLNMRHFRMGLIQTPDQLRFSYMAIIQGAKKVLSKNLQQGIAENNENERKICNYILNSKGTSSDEIETSGISPPLPPRSLPSSDLPVPLEVNSNIDTSKSFLDYGNINASLTKREIKTIVHDEEKSTSVKPTHSAEIEITGNFSKNKDVSVSTELRKRARKEREEKTAAMVQNIKKKQKESELWEKRRSFIKISLGLVLIIGIGYYVYKKYS